jgi:hypothetical protein
VIPYEYVGRGRDGRVISDWRVESFQKRQLAHLLLLLEQTDRNQAVGSVIYKKPVAGIYYAKINGRVALRPRCCIGPRDDRHVTFLERVQEIGRKEHPPLRESKASARRKSISDDPSLSQEITFHRPMLTEADHGP